MQQLGFVHVVQRWLGPDSKLLTRSKRWIHGGHTNAIKCLACVAVHLLMHAAGALFTSGE
jgi:hypothetical protein